MALAGIASKFNKTRQDMLNRRLIEAVIYDRTPQVRKLLEQGADPSARRDGRTALHFAAESGLDGIIIELVEAGAEIDAVTEKTPFETPLHLAARHGRAEAVRLLILDGADIHAKDKFGWTALHRASFYGHDKVVATLVAADANVAQKNNSGYVAIDYARKKHHSSAVVSLKEGYSRLHSHRVKSLRHIRGRNV